MFNFISTLGLAAGLTLAVGCQTGNTSGFGANGSKYEGSETETGTEETNDYPDPVDPNGPSLLSMTLVFDEYSNIGDVIEAEIEYWDEQDDVSKGEVVVKITGGDFNDASANAEIDGAAQMAWIEEGSIWFVVSGIHPWESYELTVQVKDKAGNRSNVLTGTVE